MAKSSPKKETKKGKKQKVETANKKSSKLAEKLQQVKQTKPKFAPNLKGLKKVDFKKQLLSTKTLLIVALLALLTILILSKDLFIAAMVNGRPVFRWTVRNRAEEAQGPQILDALVTDKLILQRAEKEGVQVTDEQVQEQIDQIKQSVSEQGQDFDQLLQMQGMTLEELRYRIRIQKSVEELIGAEVEVTEEEISQYIEDNEEFFPEDSTQEELEEQARQQLEQQKLSEKYQTWLKNLKEEAQVQYFVEYME
ncbi:MAG: hypothetical protein GF381_02930 [Candidatus Pacebacteria bacterium]|nr:hypothetical protein [Candidatus Paceibacterota bacterium]